MQLNPQVIVYSKISTTSLEVGKAIMTLDISVLMQPLKVLAELHFLELNPHLSFINWNLFSKI